jgi:hypothetical protein
MKNKKSEDSTKQDLSSKKESCHKSDTLTRLVAQKFQALQNNDTKTASLIQKIITLLEAKK